MKLKAGNRLVFIGDSVTDMGRKRENEAPSEGLFEPLGTGYPHVVSGLLNAVYPDVMVRITNVGISGNTVLDLKRRWQRDVLDLKPDWLSVMIGINDVWRQFDLPQMAEKHVLPDVYEATLRELVVKTLPTLSGGLVLMTPYYIEPRKDDPMRKRMDEYGAICRKIAADTGVIFVDLQAAFDRVLKYHNPNYITWDRVHPNIYGATVIAKAFLDAIGFDYSHQA